MYDINRRKQFKTVGDLKELLKDVPDETEVSICGDSYPNRWFHIEEDNSIVCLDYEDLDDSYEPYDDTDPEAPGFYGCNDGKNKCFNCGIHCINKNKTYYFNIDGNAVLKRDEPGYYGCTKGGITNRCGQDCEDYEHCRIRYKLWNKE